MKIENAVPHQRIVIESGRTVQIYIRHEDAYGTRALMELCGPVEISMVPIEKDSRRVLETRRDGGPRESRGATTAGCNSSRGQR